MYLYISLQILIQQNKVVIKMSEMKQLVIEIDEDLRTNLRMIALKEKTTVKEIVTKLIQEYVDEHK